MNDGKENKYELNEKMSVKYLRRKCKNNKYMVIFEVNLYGIRLEKNILLNL